MLNKFQKDIASRFAKDLIEDGLIFGEELEWYLKCNVVGLFKFKNEKHYFEFEEEVLKNVEKKRRFIRILDINTDEEILFKDSTEAQEYLNISKSRITTAISLKSILAKRYRVEYGKISIEKLTYKCL